MNPISIPDQPVWGTLDVDTDGNLFIGGGDFRELVFLRSVQQRAKPGRHANF